MARRKNARNDTKKLRKAFLVGSNSTCRQHIRQHYQYYSEKCKEEGIPESEHCVPRTVLEARKKAAAKGRKTTVQSKLDGMLAFVKKPKEFTREGILKAVTMFIMGGDYVGDVTVTNHMKGRADGLQAFELANKPEFRNCLVTMRPKTTKQDLPSAYDVKTYLRKEFTRHIEGLMAEIKVSLDSSPRETCYSVKIVSRTFLDVHR